MTMDMAGWLAGWMAHRMAGWKNGKMLAEKWKNKKKKAV